MPRFALSIDKQQTVIYDKEVQTTEVETEAAETTEKVVEQRSFIDEEELRVKILREELEKLQNAEAERAKKRKERLTKGKLLFPV